MSTIINITATGNTDAVHHRGGKVSVHLTGTFGGASIALQANAASSGDSDWTDIGDAATLTEAGVFVIELSPCRLRFAVTGGSNINVKAVIGGRIVSPNL